MSSDFCPAPDTAIAVETQIKDPTLFSSVRSTYQGIVEDLLQEPAESDKILQKFQARNNLGLFLCRVPGCPYADLGFDSPNLRQQHEERHSPRFQCTEPTCGLSGWTCKSRAQLKKHRDKYHGEDQVSNSLSSFTPRPEQPTSSSIWSDLWPDWPQFAIDKPSQSSSAAGTRGTFDSLSCGYDTFTPDFRD